MSAEKMLVIFLSIALFVLLVLAIVGMVYLIKFLKELNVISKKAQGVVDNAEAASRIIQYSVGTAAASKIFSNLLKPFLKNNVRKNK